MHVLQVISGREVNGAVTYVRFLTEQLLNFGHSVTVLHRKDSWIGDHPVRGARYHVSELNRTPRELRRIAALVRDEKVHLVHSHMSRAHFFGVLLRPFARVPVVATAHSCTFQLHWRFNDYVIANSGATLEFQRRFNRVAADRSRTIYCFTDLARFQQVSPERSRSIRRKLNVADDGFLLGVVGQVGTRKGQKILYHCLPELMAKIPGLKLAIVGEFQRDWPYVRRLRGSQIRHQWLGCIHWLGRRKNIEEYMAALDLCVIPSLREPLGLVALEALATGTPVVASNVGGLPEIVSHKQNGLLVPRANPGKLTEAVLQLARNRRQRLEMGQRGRERVQQKFRPELLTGQVIEVYDSLLNRKPHDGADSSENASGQLAPDRAA